MNVGFYYMANAGGRLLGTILSGALYLWIGLEGCLWVSALFLVTAGAHLAVPTGDAAAGGQPSRGTESVRLPARHAGDRASISRLRAAA